jgi:hypothetical protein
MRYGFGSAQKGSPTRAHSNVDVELSLALHRLKNLAIRRLGFASILGAARNATVEGDGSQALWQELPIILLFREIECERSIPSAGIHGRIPARRATPVGLAEFLDRCEVSSDSSPPSG